RLSHLVYRRHQRQLFPFGLKKILSLVDLPNHKSKCLNKTLICNLCFSSLKNLYTD
ncbi:hypothetical protein L9F63_014564, partial [Diploptera punctata]